MTFITDSTKTLKKSGYKITGPRMAILEVLGKEETALSAYEISGRLSRRMPVNVVTVYRVLELLEKLGLAHRVHTKEGFVRCHFSSSPGCHYFAVCRGCGRTTELLYKRDCVIEKMAPKDLAFKNIRHINELSGICEQCTSSSKS